MIVASMVAVQTSSAVALVLAKFGTDTSLFARKLEGTRAKASHASDSGERQTVVASGF